MIMKGCVQWNPVYGGKDPALSKAGTTGPPSILSAAYAHISQNTDRQNNEKK